MLRKFRETLKNKQRGAIMVFFAILVPLFLGVIGLAVDAGFLYMQKAKLQDVADATALAGAGHLKDENREEQVEKAIVAFAGANGYGKDKDEAVSSKFPELGDKVDDSKVTLEENAAWKIAYAIDTGMKDKDAKNGELRDHVRVVILKRVPTFFIRMLFPEQREVVVKAVAAAEYVEGEQVVSYGGPKIYAGGYFNFLNNNKNGNSIKVADGSDFSLFVGGGDVKYDKLPTNSVGTMYHNHHPGQSTDPWKFVPVSKYYTPYYENEEQKKASEEMMKIFNEKEKVAKSKCDSIRADVNSYKNPANGSKKRYIDKDMNNIVAGDNDIELYVQLSMLAKTIDNNGRPILRNQDLKGVTRIKSLYVVGDYGSGTIDTTGIYYGDVFSHGKIALEGSDNHFNGICYSEDAILIHGQNNSFGDINIGENNYILSSNGVVLGAGFKIAYDSNGLVKEYENQEHTEATSTWSVNFGRNDGSGSNGSSGSDTATKSRVRLVI